MQYKHIKFDDAVYLIKILLPGRYKKLIWGQPAGVYNYPQDRNGDNRYKYGTTKNGISGRYKAGSYVYNMIKATPPFMKDEFKHKNLDFWTARIVEKHYIYTYYLQHHAFPPGNSKLG